MMIGIGWAVRLALGAGVPEKAAKPVAIAGIVVLAALALWAVVAMIRSDAVQNMVNEANVEFLEDKNEAVGEEDVASDDREEQFQQEVLRTEELVDEALEKGCVVSDYLHSDGAVCLRPGGRVLDTAP